MPPRFWIAVVAVLVLAACERVAPSVVESPAPQVARAVPVDAAVPDATPPDAAPSDLDELADPAPDVYRWVSVGLAVTPSRTTFVLRRVGNEASLRVIAESADDMRHLDSGWPERWNLDRTTTFIGEARREGTRTTFHLTSATGIVVELSCRPARRAIHRQRARFVREPHVPGRDYPECTGVGVWRPAATQIIDGLACSAREREGDANRVGDVGGRNLLFAPQPGVELVYINSDCLLQGGGLRRIDPAE